MAKKKYVMMLDTETANAFTDERGKLNLSDSQTYDCGFAICDLHGNMVEEHSYVVKETFFDADMMNSAYYANKLPQYWKDIWDGKRKVVSVWELRRIIAEKIKEYDIAAIVAHNARFDRNTLDKTIRYCSSSACKRFMPYGTEWWDTLKMAHEVVAPTKAYKKFCEDNGFMTKPNKNTGYTRPRETAEVLYRFITNQLDFDEAHTGLEDVKIEYQIFMFCLNKHKKMTRKL